MRDATFLAAAGTSITAKHGGLSLARIGKGSGVPTSSVYGTYTTAMQECKLSHEHLSLLCAIATNSSGIKQMQ